MAKLTGAQVQKLLELAKRELAKIPMPPHDNPATQLIAEELRGMMEKAVLVGLKIGLKA